MHLILLWCLLSCIDGEDDDDDAVPGGAVTVAKDMSQVSLTINVHASILFCNLVKL